MTNNKKHGNKFLEFIAINILIIIGAMTLCVSYCMMLDVDFQKIAFDALKSILLILGFIQLILYVGKNKTKDSNE